MELEHRERVVTHTYEPLPGDHFIRLIRLAPALHIDEPLHFTFMRDYIENVVAQYEALSYTWGEPRLEYPLYLDGTCVMVTKNLDKALRRLRHPTAPRVLWADAVCIDQSNNEEKAKQIPLMTKIFQGASRVLAWLDGGADEERGMQTLNLLSRQRGYALKDFKDTERLKEQGFVTVFVSRFLSLAWFTRLWIIQEIVMNTDVILLCGSSELSWLRFTIALKIYANIEAKDLALKDKYNLEALQKIAQLWETHSLDDTNGKRQPLVKSESILDLVQKFHSYGCTDGRDRIFALYSITSDIQPLATYVEPSDRISAYGTRLPSKRSQPIYLDVDYSLDVRQVYRNFAAAGIASYRGTLILDAALRRSYQVHEEAWLSWVPDWRISPSGAVHSDLYTRISFSQVSPEIIKLSFLQPHVHNPDFTVHTIIPIFERIDVSELARTQYLHVQLASWPRPVISVLLRALLGTRSERDVALYFDGFFETAMKVLQTMQNSHQHFFIASSPCSNYHALGYGSATMIEGDKLIYVPHDLPFWLDKGEYYPHRAFIVRPKAARQIIGQGTVTTYRLVGTAWLALINDWTVDVPIQQEELYVE